MSKPNENAEPSFESLWDEGEEPAKNQGEPAAPAPATEGKTPEPDQKAADATQGKVEPEDGSEDGGTPAAQSGETSSEENDAGSKDEEWLAALPEDVRKHIEEERAAAVLAAKAAEDRYKALHERVAPTQRQLGELQAQLNQQRNKPAPETPSAPKKADPKLLDSYFDSDAWKSWAEDFPGDAKVLRTALETQQQTHQDVVQQLQQQMDSITERLGKTEQVTSRTALETEEQKLAAKHPDWMELNQSDDFWGWFMDDYRARQPKSLRPLFYDEDKLRSMWEDSEFAIAVIDAFKVEHPSDKPAATTTTTPPAKTESTQAAPEKTQSNPRLDMSVAPNVKGQSQVPPAVSLDSLTPAEQFEHVWKHTE